MTSVIDPQDIAPQGAAAPVPCTARAAFADAVRRAGYEALPFPSAHDKVLAHVPTEVPPAVTATEVKGLEPTVDLAVRLVRDTEHCSGLVARLGEAGGYRADRFLDRLAPAFTGPLAGIHVVTSDGLEATQTWRQTLLARLS